MSISATVSSKFTPNTAAGLTVDYGRIHDTERMEFAVHANGYDESSSDT